ncbi:GNAT family N-acetyltransferase [Peribacillus huizhouensis]|uniref:Ribosomal protein S18 acetylase RimI-like enzyme n=1 Tax=Peribacillus huizhouensis TaxID=1501239 RepID=A0ABR6CWI3_9BACI|nr:GNAT family N-acetyltransferase [Peribacillus huizhouensis]MBA9028692.1 ribosomal protein S18 acetylase RimI-like enzyme [Peribacillus huizhouensis]
MLLRQAKPADAPISAYLIRLAIQDIAEALTDEQEEKAILDVLQYFFSHPNNRLSYENTLIIEIAGNVAGLIVTYLGSEAEQLDRPIVKRLREKNNNSEIMTEKEAEPGDFYIDTVSVNPQYWGKGVGTALIEAAELLGKSKGHRRMSLNVEVKNTRAHRLYSKLGYKSVNCRQINGHDYEYMVKHLS